MASICNDERVALGLTSWHVRKTLTLSAQLQRDSPVIVLALDHAEDKDCKPRAMVDTEAVFALTTATESGRERWTVERCGKRLSYEVSYTPSARGGTDISVASAR